MPVRRLTRHFLLVAFVSLFFIHNSPAQTTNTTVDQAPPIPGAGHNYVQFLNETVNPATGSVSIRVGAPIPPGRGISLPFAVSYDSNSEHHNPGSNTFDNQGFLSRGGWIYVLPSLSFQTHQIQWFPPGSGIPYTCSFLNDFVFQDADGSTHQLNLAVFSQPGSGGGPGGCQYPSTTPGDVPSGGDGFFTATIVSWANPQVTVTSGSGSVYHFSSTGNNRAYGSQKLGGILPDWIEDANGNIVHITAISVSGGFTLTDTLGRTEVSGSGFGASGNTISISGLAQPYSLTWGTSNSAWTYNAQASSDIGGNGCGSGGSGTYNTTLPEVTTITLPNGRSYQFQYGDSVSGLLTKVVYPSGGYIRYVWGTNPLSTSKDFYPDSNGYFNCHALYDTQALQKRFVSFDGVNEAIEQDFIFSASSTTWVPSNQSPATKVWTAKTTTVVTKDCARTNFNCSTAPSTTTTYTYAPYPAPIGPYDEYYAVKNFQLVWGGVPTPQYYFPVEQTVSYQATGGPVLRTTTKAWWDQFSLACELTTLDNGSIAGTYRQYGTGGVVTNSKEYDLGLITSTAACQPGSAASMTAPSTTPTREVATTYTSYGPTPIGGYIYTRPLTAKTYGNGTLTAETDYSYDQGTVTSATTPSGTHDETYYGPASTASRGNPTTITKRCLQSCSNSVSTLTYDETGQVTTSKDSNNNPTQFFYTDKFDSNPPSNTNAYLTKIVDTLGHVSQFKYAYSDGQLIQSWDQNDPTAAGPGTAYTYNTPPSGCSYADGLRRLSTVAYLDGGKTTYCYNDTAPSPSITTNRLVSNSPAVSISTTTVMDGMGHVTQTQLTTDPDGTTSTDTAYDGFGRVRTQSNPHRSTSATTDGTTTNYYDALGRVCLVVPPDGTLPTGNACPTSQPSNTIFTAYSGNTTTVTDQAGKSRKSVTDGLGRLTQVFEDPGTSPHLNYETDYAYDVLNNLLSVNQKGNDPNSANWRTRTFTYDSLSRLLCASNPENSSAPCPATATTTYTTGTTGYAYDANGNLSTKTSPKPNQTASATVIATYTYDALNRLTQKSFNDGPPATPTVKYVYDGAAAPSGCTLPLLTYTNPIGRRTGMCDAAGSEAWAYDSLGRTTADNRITSGVAKLTTYSYNLDGSLYSSSTPTFADGSHPLTMTYQPGGAGRALGATGGVTIEQVHYSPAGALCYMQGDWDYNWITTSTFNNRLQPTRTQTGDFFPGSTHPPVCGIGPINGANQTTVQDFSYSFVDASSHNNGNVSSITNNLVTNRSQTFSYDSLNRLKTAQTTSTHATDATNCWAETYSYDPWGNLTKLGADTTNQSAYIGCTQESGFDFSATGLIGTNNRINSAGYVYDTPGNLTTSPGAGTVVFNAENQMTLAGGVTYLYDGDGRRVSKSNGTLYWYGTGSDPLMETNTSGAAINSYIFFGGKRVARSNSSGINWYMTDHLGTSRVVWSTAGMDVSDFYPFGGERVIQATAGGNNRYKFTGKERDSESGLDNFGARFDSSTLGRFMSPDPLGGHRIDPQTLNKYTYVRDNPLKLTDPTGLDFSLTCSKNNGTTCQGGYIYYKDKNGDYQQTVIKSDDKGNLTDQSNNKYSATISGAGVSFTQAGSKQSSMGEFINGSNATTIQGTGDLSSFKFNFTYSNWPGNVSAGGTFSYNGTFLQAESALQKAGFYHYESDDNDIFHPSTLSYHALDFRSPGEPGTGAGSGHFTVDEPWGLSPFDTLKAGTGDVHLGEHNSYVPGGFWPHFGEVINTFNVLKDLAAPF